MSSWVRDLVSTAAQHKQAASSAAADKQRRHSLAGEAYERQIDTFWAVFLSEIQAVVEDFNAQVSETDRITINTPEPAMVGLRKDVQPGGQFVARLRRDEHRAEISVVAARTVKNIGCPIVANDGSPSSELTFRASNGLLHDPKRAVEILLAPFLRHTLGETTESGPKGGGPIGF